MMFLRCSHHQQTSMKDIIILGSGLAGSLLSILLAQRGYAVQVYEKRGDPRRQEAAGGRSINLALSRRGWKALEAAGVDEAVREQAIAMRGRMIHDPEGSTALQPYGTAGQAIYSVSRGALNQLLLDEAERHGVQLFFEHPCQSVNLEQAQPLIHDLQQDTQLTPKADLLIGADGAYSTLREAMRFTPRFNYSQHYIEHGYKELHIPPVAGDFAMEPHALHIWPRGGYMLIALPNADESFTATLFLPYEGPNSFAQLEQEDQLQTFFNEQFPDALALMPTLTEDFFRNPTADLVTIRCYPWSRYGRNLLIGDAAHAIVPFYGQGMNAAFEDCRLLAERFAEPPTDLAAELEQFQQQRKPDADAIAELALQNFVEMRDRVADPRFVAQKQIEAELHRRYPDRWIPLYARVTFSDDRYSEALRRGKQQEAVMQQLMRKQPNPATLTDEDYARIVGELDAG